MQNISPHPKALAALRARLAKLERPPSRGRFPLPAPVARSLPTADMASGALHDLYAETASDAVAVNAFALGLAIAAARGKPLLWGMHDMALVEGGRPYGMGVLEMGVPPDAVLLVRTRTVQALLAVGEEGVRNPAIGAVVLSAWGEAPVLSFTASRRLALAASASGVTAFLARSGAAPVRSAAETRWSVRAAASTPLEGGAPGRPTFAATLLRHRGGSAPGTWIMEWDRERRSWRDPAPLPGDLVSVPTQRPAAAAGGLRRAG